jgi:hypothetical protein
MKVSFVLDIVGIWEYGKHIYILRKHPGIAMLKKRRRSQGMLMRMKMKSLKISRPCSLGN